MSKNSHLVDTTVAYDESETGHVVMFLIHQAIEMKGLDHHLLCPMQCCMNGVLINEVPIFLEPIPIETMHAIKIENSFHAAHPTIIALKLPRVTSYFDVKKLSREENED